METLGYIGLGAVGGLAVAVYALIRGWNQRDELGEDITDARDDHDETKGKLADEKDHSRDLTLKLTAAEETIRRMEATDATKRRDPVLEKWFATALQYVSPDVAEGLRAGLRAERNASGGVHADKDGADQGAGPGADAGDVPDAPEIPIATELR